MKKIFLALVALLFSSPLFCAPLTVTVMPSGQGGDYTSLAAAWNANERDNVALGSVTFRIGGTWSSADDTYFTMDGYTTGASSGILITTVGTARNPTCAYSTSYYYRDDNNAWPIQVGYVILDGIQRGRDYINYENAGAVECVVQNSIIKQAAESTKVCFIGNHNISLINNIIIASGTYGTGAGIEHYGGVLTINNNTIIGFAKGIWQEAGTVNGSNNICQYNDTDYVGTITGDTNISMDNTSPNTALRNKTVSFVGSGDYSLSSSDTVAKDAGTTLTYAYDILGTARPQGTAWDIGAHELIQSSPAPAPSVPLLPQVLIWEN